jgi:iron(III) transport system substrate-binding protein
MLAGKRPMPKLFSLLVLIFAFHAFDPHVVFGQSKPAWQTEWERTLKGAEAEGQVVVYTGDTFDSILLEVFQKRHPKIKLTTVTGRGFELGQRVLSERRAGKYIPDVFIQGATTPVVLLSAKALDPIKPLLLLPEVVDQSKWFESKHQYLDQSREYIFVFEGTARTGGIIYNTNLVNPAEVGSFWDLLQPKWKGKIVAIDPLTAGPATHFERFFFYNTELGPEFLRKLFGGMDVTLTRQDERLIDWVAVGKFAFGLFPRGTDITAAEKAGLPVKPFLPGHFKEGASLGSPIGTISFFNRAPHPNAAKVLINWVLSREGQIAWLDYTAKTDGVSDSMREDIPKDKVGPEGRRVAGTKYLMADQPELMDMKPIYEVIKKALAEAKQN